MEADSLSQPQKEGKMKKRFMAGLKGFCIGAACLSLVLGIFMMGSVVHAAAPYPDKPIKLIVPNDAGADADVLIRQLAQRVSVLVDKPIMIVNKPGGGSSIGMREVHDSKPDGYTIGMSHATILINKPMGNMPYDHEGFTVLGTYATFIPIIVGATKTSRPFKTIQEVLSFAKANPGEVSIATSGVGQSWWVATLEFQEGTGAKFNIIPQAGTGAYAIAQAAGGHTDLAVVAVAAAKSQIEGGLVRFLAIFGSKKFPGYENIPTMKDAGYNNVNWESTQILIGPPGMPKEAVDKLVKAFEVASNEPEFKKFLVSRGAFPFYLPPDKAVAFFDEQRKVVQGVMDKAGILKAK
jgi:tripartite-type tricarboxylate transporter receptor subunit TctC